MENAEQLPFPTGEDAPPLNPEATPVATDQGVAPVAAVGQPPVPVRPPGSPPPGGSPTSDPNDPALRAAVEAIMDEQRQMSLSPDVEEPPDSEIVRQPAVPVMISAGTAIPRTEEWMALPEPYSNMLVLLWVDFPPKLAKQIDSRDQNQVMAAAKRIVIGHNSWADEDGMLPHPGTDEFWERLAPRLQIHVIRSILRGMIRLPNSPKPKKTKS